MCTRIFLNATIFHAYTYFINFLINLSLCFLDYLTLADFLSSFSSYFYYTVCYFFQFQQLKIGETPQNLGDGSFYFPVSNQFINKGFNHPHNQVKRGTPPRFGRYQPDLTPHQQQPFNGYSYIPPWFMSAAAAAGGGTNRPTDGIGIFGAPPEGGRFDHLNPNARGYQRRPYRLNNNDNYHNGYNPSGSWNFPFKTEEELFHSNTPKANINLELYDSIPVKQSGPDWTAVDPLTSFNDIQLHKILMDNIKRAQYVHPTPVQKYALPIILAKRDLMACAQTGSGKTAAFLIPILHMMLESVSCESDKSEESVSLQLLKTKILNRIWTVGR